MLLLGSHAHAQPPLPDWAAPTLVDGEWLATFYASGPISGDGFRGDISYTGHAEFVSAEGELSGAWEMTGVSQFSGECFDGTGNILVNGLVEGVSSEPMLRQASFSGVGTATVCGLGTQTQPIQPAGPLATHYVQLDTSTCEQVLGHFHISANMAVAAGGAASDLEAPFIAIRTASLRDDPTRYMDAIAELIQQGELFLTQLRTGEPLDRFALDALLQRAEGLSRSLKANAECGLTSDGRYAAIITSIIEDVLEWALDHPEQFSTSDLLRVILAGVRTGVIGAGATSLEQMNFEQIALAEVERRLEETNDCVDLTLLAQAAFILDEPGLFERADAASLAACLGG